MGILILTTYFMLMTYPAFKLGTEELCRDIKDILTRTNS